MHASRNICPPKKRLRELRAIVDANFQFEIGASRVEADAVHAFHTCHWIVIAAPNGFRAISMLFNFEIGRQKGRRTMVLRPIEFNTAGNPWTGETDEGGLDDRLPVDYVVAVCFVLQDMNTTANFRKDEGANKFVFD